MVSPESFQREVDENVKEERMAISKLKIIHKDPDNLCTQTIHNVLGNKNHDQDIVLGRPSIKEWLINGLLHCQKCKKSKQITNAFRRPICCPDCKVNYINQCAVCKKKFTKFKTLRKHLQFRCDNQHYNTNRSYSIFKSETFENNIKNGIDITDDINQSENNALYALQTQIKQEDSNLCFTNSNIHIIQSLANAQKSIYKCSTCEKVFTNKYRKNRHEKYCLKCERCDFKATESEQLRAHMKKMHYSVDPNDYFKCLKCDKPFSCKYSKNNHEKYCGLELNLKCTKCYYETTRIERLQAHIKSIHISILPTF